MIKKLILLSTAIASLSTAYAADTTFQSTADVSNSCLISMEDVSFGLVDITKPSTTDIGASYVQTGDVSIYCNKGTPYVLSGESPLVKNRNSVTAIGHFMVGEQHNDELVYVVTHNKQWFGDGLTYQNGSPKTLPGIGSGEKQTITLEFNLYPYTSWPTIMPIADNYVKTHTLTLSY